MPIEEARVHTLVDEPCLAKVVENHKDGVTKISAYISVMLKDTDWPLQPMWDELNGKCFSLRHSSTHVDQNYFLGRARKRVFELLPFCSALPHNCALEVKV
jgi:hypothetical protein